MCLVAHSGGVRQEVVRLHSNASGFLLNPPGYHDFLEHLRRSVFCLAPSGWGSLKTFWRRCSRQGRQAGTAASSKLRMLAPGQQLLGAL